MYNIASRYRKDNYNMNTQDNQYNAIHWEIPSKDYTRAFITLCKDLNYYKVDNYKLFFGSSLEWYLTIKEILDLLEKGAD